MAPEEGIPVNVGKVLEEKLVAYSCKSNSYPVFRLSE
jgi:hypothetical protein